MSARVRFEHDHYPIVVLRIPPHGSVGGVHAWYDETERLLDECASPIALVHDLRHLVLGDITSANRRAVAHRSAALVSHPRIERLAADARIVSSRLAVSAITAVAWLAGEVPWPQRTFADEGAALRWCHTRLDAALGSRGSASDRM